ncbi:MAG: M23 family metallopeptidase [Lachnospiraceae bacterium]|nr:M23 family metallopeptidase [Lachnospiraceae bacterium]
MAKYWLFTSEQKLYLDDLIAADEIWDSVLGMNNLAMAAYSELGQTAEKYYNTLALHDGDEWSIAFVYYILKENGYVSDNYVRKTSSIEAFRQYCILYKWMTLTPSIGDIAFIKINGSDRVGIISNIDDDYIYIILGNYDRTGIVKEIYVSKSSGILTGAYAHISLPDVVSVINSNSFYTIGNGECLWPVPGKYYVTSPYGARWGTIHKGLDISCPIGTSVVAAKSGTVISSYRSSSAGEYIVIDHGDGMCTEYMHNSIRLVSSGDYVDAGQVIAYSGNTGQSTGPHCHFGVRINGERVDPAPYLGIPSQIGDVSEYVTGE